MKFLKDVYIKFLSLFNYPYISKDVLNAINGPVLLHISDTPVDIYSYIFRIIDILKPQFIVHTGDMADNIKLGIYKDKVGYYLQGAKWFIERLEKNECSKIYYVMGNHDDYEIVSQLSKKGIILEEGLLTLNSCNIAVGHYYKEHSEEVDFNRDIIKRIKQSV